MLPADRRVFIMTRGMVSMRPLQLASASLGADVSRVGELDTKLLEQAGAEFQEALSQRLAAAGCPTLEADSLARLRDASVRSMSASVGVDFTVSAGLLPMLLQPIYVLVVLGGSAGTAMQAHMLVYGFVASCMAHVSSNDPEQKSTPFCACLMSPDLLSVPASREETPSWTWEYSVRRVAISSIREAAERDAQLLRESVKLGRLASKPFFESIDPSSEELQVEPLKEQPTCHTACKPYLQLQTSRLEAPSVAPASDTQAPTQQKGVPSKQESPVVSVARSALPQKQSSRSEPSLFSSLWAQAPWSQVQRSSASTASAGPLRELSPQLVSSPSGHFCSTVAGGPEALRNFARVFLTKGQQRRVYIMARGMVSMRPMQLAGAGLDTARMGDMDEQVVDSAKEMFTDGLAQWLVAVGAPPVPASSRESLCAAAAAAMSGSVGIDFSQHTGLLPTFMQPMFVLLILAGDADVPPQVRLITYGFVAGSMAQIGMGRTEMQSTPFCARLLSPDLLTAASASGSSWEWEYAVYRVRSTSIKESAERDATKLREVVGSGRWK
jgi:hypothetical protein